MYQLILLKKAEKDLNRIAKKRRPQVVKVLFSLRENPFLGKTLKGKLAGCYSFRIWPYRIVYRLDKERLVVLVVRIGHRQGIYK